MGNLSYVDANYDSVQADIRAGEREPMYTRIRSMMPHTILCTRPHRKLSKDLCKTTGGIVMPDSSSRISEEWLLACTVLRHGAWIPPEIREGSVILVPQFSGGIIFDDIDRVETSLWIVSDSEVLAVLES